MSMRRKRELKLMEVVPMSELLNWSSEPEYNDQIPRLKLERVSLKSEVFAFVNPAIDGLKTHYVKQKTVPCLKFPYCDACKKGLSFKWKGYGFVIFKNGHTCMLEFTEKAFTSLKSTVPNVRQLRGVQGYLVREKNTIRSKMNFKLHSLQTQAELPPETPLRPTLNLIFGSDQIAYARSVMGDEQEFRVEKEGV